MRNFDIKLLKKSAKSLVRKNYKTIAATVTIVLAILFACQFLLQLFGLKAGLIALGVNLLVLAPLLVGGLHMLYQMTKNQEVKPIDIFTWYADWGKYVYALKATAYYIGTLVMWALVYVAFPLGVIYIIWGQNLLTADGYLNIGIAAVAFTGVLLVAIMPYCIHTLRYVGGLLLSAQRSHLKVAMRFEIGRDFIAPHIYRTALLIVTFFLYLAIGFGPMLGAVVFAPELGYYRFPLFVAGLLTQGYFVIPYLLTTLLLAFERMQRPKEEIKYEIYKKKQESK